MSCVGFLTPAQRAALAEASRAGADEGPLSAFASPPATDGKRRRVQVLARSGDATIRESAAMSRHASPELLAALAGDPVASVRCCVARNSQVPHELLASLATDGEATVRAWVAAAPGLQSETRAALGSDPDSQVRAVVAWAERWGSPDSTHG